VAHHLQEDFWHVRLFTARDGVDAQALWREAEGDRPSQELRADVHGIIYAAMAGFNPHAVVADDPAVNFFQEWVQTRADTHPSPQQRAAAVRARLLQVVTKTDLFHVGLQFYQAGKYQQAIDAFAAFQRVFESREVYHNLAVSHHQLALQEYRLWKQQPQVIPFLLSMTIDPQTRAQRVQLMQDMTRGAEGPAMRVRRHLDNAITFSRAAIARDPAYEPAANNLGAALIARGVLYDTLADLHAAVATLLEVPAASHSPATLTNLGVAYWYLGEREKSHLSWHEAYRQAPTYAPVVFNLGEQASRAHRAEEAHHYWRQYVQLAPFSPHTAHLMQRVPSLEPPPLPVSLVPSHEEHVEGIRVGDFEGDGLRGWGTPHQRHLVVSGESFTVSTYPQHVWTLSRAKIIHMILVQEGYGGTSVGEIALGEAADAVRARYGAPSRILEMRHGQSWCYDSQGIAFHLRQGKVVSWLLYDL
jgi:hypothetical protein